MPAFLMHIQVKAGSEDDAVRGLVEIQQLARGDAGNHEFVWLHHTTDPTKFTLFEQWDTQDHLDEHLKNITPTWNRFAAILAGPPVSEPVLPVSQEVAAVSGSTTPATCAVKWSHAALNCRDLPTTENFYTTWFGFTRSRVFEAADRTTIFIRLDDSYLELFVGASVDGNDPFAASADGSRRPGITRHLAFQVDDVDAFLERMGNAAAITQGP
ncbi:MAG: glyoxylase family protein, partial [Mycobacterium sp.]|nr:glyoxylase family protein [Mycobacterium sp.]